MRQENMDVASLYDTYRSALLDDILPFWLKHGLDQENGGYFTALDRDGSLLDSDKSVWVQGRFSWLLSTLHQEFGPNEEWLRVAKSGLDFIDQHCVDREDDLLWFHVTADGRPSGNDGIASLRLLPVLPTPPIFNAPGKKKGDSGRKTFLIPLSCTNKAEFFIFFRPFRRSILTHGLLNPSAIQ